MEFWRSRQGSETYSYYGIENGDMIFKESLSCSIDSLQEDTSEKSEFIESIKKLTEGKSWIECKYSEAPTITNANIFAELTESASTQTTKTASIQEADEMPDTLVQNFSKADLSSVSAVVEASSLKKVTVPANSLTTGKEYLFLVVKDKNADNLLAADNIIYIDQKTAAADSGLTFDYEKSNTIGEELMFEEYDSSAVSYGDLDNDGDVTLKDAQLVLKAALRIVALDDAQKVAADVDGDNDISLKDAQLLLKRALRIIDTFPAEAV